MSVRRLLHDARARLTASGVASPATDAEQLLAHVLGVPRGRLLLVQVVERADQDRFDELVERRQAREPLQHLTGHAGFRNVEVVIGPGVFVPRPETEQLTGWAVDAMRDVIAQGTADPVVVDLCTGSGAVAAALADEVPGARVHAVELSPTAHGYAERNLAGTGVDLRLGDAADAFADLDGWVDVVVANPPYIPLHAFEGVDIEARTHDPAWALWSGVDGLDMIRTIERVGARLLRPGRWLGCEHADLQGESVPALFAASGRWVDVSDHEDLAGRPRFTTARAASGWHDRSRE